MKSYWKEWTDQIRKIDRRIPGRKLRKRVTWVAACLVVFVTAYSLVLPALTFDTGTAEDTPGIRIGTAEREAADMTMAERIIDESIPLAAPEGETSAEKTGESRQDSEKATETRDTKTTEKAGTAERSVKTDPEKAGDPAGKMAAGTGTDTGKKADTENKAGKDSTEENRQDTSEKNSNVSDTAGSDQQDQVRESGKEETEIKEDSSVLEKKTEADRAEKTGTVEASETGDSVKKADDASDTVTEAKGEKTEDASSATKEKESVADSEKKTDLKEGSGGENASVQKDPEETYNKEENHAKSGDSTGPAKDTAEEVSAAAGKEEAQDAEKSAEETESADGKSSSADADAQPEEEKSGRETTETDGTTADQESVEADGAEAAENSVDSAQEFTEDLEAEKLHVSVKAEAGTFPEGTRMAVEPVQDQDVLDQIAEKAQALEEVRKQQPSEDSSLSTVVAVDITFLDADGTEIQPTLPVQVQITGESVAQAADPVVVHVDQANEVTFVSQLDEQTLKASVPEDTVAFEAEHFSMYAIVGTSPGVSISMTVGEIETITPKYDSGVTEAKYQSYTWSTSKSSVVSLQSGQKNSSIKVKAESVGTATLTLKYEYGKNQNSTSLRTAIYTIIVSEDTQLTEEDCTAQESNTDGMTVTVRETGKLKKLSDYHVVVENADDEYSEEDDILKAYHIYLADKTGKEVQNFDDHLNLKVTLSYHTSPDWFDRAKDIKHYKNGKSQSINGIIFGKDKKTISFIVSGFSQFVITQSANTTENGTQVSAEQGSIMNGVTVNDANEWQIVSGEYSGNAGADKTAISADGFVRVQKNVIPTETENEFWVYLSADYNQKQSWKNFFENATYLATESANFHGQAGSLQDDMTGNEQVRVAPHSYSGYKRTNIFEIYDSQGKYLTSQQLWWGSGNKNPNNFTIFIKLSNGQYFVVGAKLSKEESENNKLVRLQLSSEAERVIYGELSKKIDINYIDDQMGDYITYLDSASGDLGTASYNASTRTLHWIPKVKTDPEREESVSGNTKTIWYKNVAELRYRVRLNVEQDGFNSCAQNMDSITTDLESYAVNTKATLTYERTKSVDFPVPYVRGLLYDLKIKKVDEKGNPLSGAQFSLTGTSGTTGTDVANQYVLDHTSTYTSGEDGYITINGLPWGNYILKETKPPSGYSEDPAYKDGKKATLCHTTTPNVLEDNGTHKILKEGSNDYLTVTNKKNKITVTKAVAVTGDDINLADVEDTIYIALKKHGTNEYVTDSSGNILYRKIGISGGTPNPESVTFEGIETGIYDVIELAEEPENETVTVLSVGKRITTKAGKRIQLAGISENYVGADESIVTGNNADLSNSNTAQVNFTNTYSKQTTIDKVVIKKWQSEGETEAGMKAPADAKVTIGLYRKANEGETPSPVPGSDGKPYTIVLDGTVDEGATTETGGELTAWQATFTGLDVSDEDGNDYIYLAREISGPAEYAPYISSAHTSPMGENDYLDLSSAGTDTITNKQKTTSITIKKVDTGGTFLPGARFTLYRIVTDSQGKEYDSQVDVFTISEKAGVTFTGLYSGKYKLTETHAPDGYIITVADTVFNVNADGTGSVITWGENASKPENVQGLTKTEAEGDTITIINEPGAELPATGGMGIVGYVSGGMGIAMMSLMSGGLYVMRRREEAEELLSGSRIISKIMRRHR